MFLVFALYLLLKSVTSRCESAGYSNSTETILRMNLKTRKVPDMISALGNWRFVRAFPCKKMGLTVESSCVW